MASSMIPDLDMTSVGSVFMFSFDFETILQPKIMKDSIAQALVPKTKQVTNGPPHRFGKPHTGCTVPVCEQPYCRLVSHRGYNTTQSLRTRAAQSGVSKDNQASASLIQAGKLLKGRRPSTLRIGPAGIECLPRLAIEDAMSIPAITQSQIRGLFNRYFCEHFEALTDIYYSSGCNTQIFKQTVLEIALQKPIHSLTIVAQTQLHETRQQGLRMGQGHDLTSLLYTKLLGLCREALSNPEEQTLDLIVLAIVVLCYYDISMGRADSLRAHRKGLAALTAEIGGVHNLGLSLHASIRVDRAASIFLFDECLFPAPNPPDDALHCDHNLLYGLEFGQLNLVSLMRPDVLSVCKSVARFMDIIELEADSSKLSVVTSPDEQLSSAGRGLSTEHVQFLRDHVDFQITSLLANVDALTVPEQCTLMAAKIVVDVAVSVDWLPALDMHLSITISELLSLTLDTDMEHDCASLWEGCYDLLLWILFACALPCGGSPTHRDNIERMISSIAELHFDATVDWNVRSFQQSLFKQEKSSTTSSPRQGYAATDVWAVLCKFVWSHNLESLFDGVCSRIAR